MTFLLKSDPKHKKNKEVKKEIYWQIQIGYFFMFIHFEESRQRILHIYDKYYKRYFLLENKPSTSVHVVSVSFVSIPSEQSTLFHISNRIKYPRFHW